MVKTVYSSDTLVGDRRAAWKKVIQEVYANLQIDIGPREKFSGKICRSIMGETELTEVHTDSEFAQRTARHISRKASNSYAYLFVRKGVLSVTQFGRDGQIGSGHYTLLHLDKPYLFSHADRMEMICLKVPAHLLRLREPQLDWQCAVVRSADAGMGRLAAHHINGLCGDDLSGMDELLPSLSKTAVDLLSLLFDSSERSSLPDESAVQAALRRRACAYLVANLAAPDLDPAAVAQALGVSVRYLHRCFEPMGTTVMRYLTQLRLESCHRELLDPLLKGQPVSEIALRNGFRNVSHFSDAFKTHFGVTARDVKAGATAALQARLPSPCPAIVPS